MDEVVDTAWRETMRVRPKRELCLESAVVLPSLTKDEIVKMQCSDEVISRFKAYWDNNTYPTVK